MYPHYELWFTGHSLGGALAALAMAEVSSGSTAIWNPQRRMRLITFGQPRVGDEDWANAMDSLLPESQNRTYRVTHKRDVVPHLPPHNYKNYTHHVNEVWYPKDMDDGADYVTCEGENEPAACAATISHFYSVHDHTYYFEREVDDFGVAGCVDDDSDTDT